MAKGYTQASWVLVEGALNGTPHAHHSADRVSNGAGRTGGGGAINLGDLGKKTNRIMIAVQRQNILCRRNRKENRRQGGPRDVLHV